MLGLLGDFLGIIIAFAVLFGILCTITGEDAKGVTIITNTVTAMILYAVILSVFNFDGTGNGVFSSAIPMIKGLERYDSVLAFVKNAPGDFAKSFVELVTLSLIISYVSNLLSFQSAGAFGKITSRIILVFAGIIMYGAVMDSISENVVIKWCVYAVESFITIGSIAYTPLMLAANLTGLKHDNWLLIYLINALPKCKLGKAISAAISSVIMFLVLAVILENQYGSIKYILRGGTAILETMGGIVVMCMGLYFMLGCLKAGKR